MKHRLFIFSMLVFGTSACLYGQSTGHRQLLEGDRWYGKQIFDKAEAAYRKAGSLTGTYNAGVAAVQQGKYEVAMDLFETIVKSGDPRLRADALYNLGNAALAQGRYQEAIAAYEKSLRQQPNQPDAKKNLQIAKRKQQEPPESTPPPPPPPPPPPMAQSKVTFVDQGRQAPKRESIPPDMPAETARRILEQAIAPREQDYARQYREGVRGIKPSGKKKNW